MAGGGGAVRGLFGPQEPDDPLRQLLLRGLHLLVLQGVVLLAGGPVPGPAALPLKVFPVKAVPVAVVFLHRLHVGGEQPLHHHQVHQLAPAVAVAAQGAHVPEPHPAVGVQQVPLLGVQAGHQLVVAQADGLLLQKPQQQVGEFGVVPQPLRQPKFQGGHPVKGVAPGALPQGQPPDDLPLGGAHKGRVALAVAVEPQPVLIIFDGALADLQPQDAAHLPVDGLDGGRVLQPGPAYLSLHAFSSVGPARFSAPLLYRMLAVLPLAFCNIFKNYFRFCQTSTASR